MIRHDFTIEIKAPVEKVFAFTTDFVKLVQWQDGVSQVSQSPQGATRLGTTFTLTRTFLGRHIQAAGAVTEFDPGRKCTFTSTSGPIQLSLTQTFESIPSGTRLSMHLEAEPGGFFKLAESAIDHQLKSTFESQAQQLKKILES